MLKKIGKLLFNIFRVLIFSLIILVLAVIITQRFSNNNKSFFGFRIFSIITGSMEPEYKVSDVIIAKEKDYSKIAVGDDLVYVGKEGTFLNKIVTHRVIRIIEEDGINIYETKGIANTASDPLVKQDQIYGVVLTKSKTLTFIFKLVTTPIGFFMFIFLPTIAFIGIEVIDFFKHKDDELDA